MREVNVKNWSFDPGIILIAQGVVTAMTVSSWQSRGSSGREEMASYGPASINITLPYQLVPPTRCKAVSHRIYTDC